MTDFVDLKQAIDMPGLRLVLISTTPSPWGEAVKGFLFVKRIPYIAVRHPMGKSQELLRKWTAQESAPVAIYNDERPRSTWPEQLYLAERLAPDPPLIPGALEDRVAMFGLINEICGETGLAWSGRLRYLHQQLRATAPSHHRSSDADDIRAIARQLGDKYGYSPKTAEGATRKIVEVLQGLSARMEQQRARGSRFFIGDGLTALDIYWAAFCNTFNPPADAMVSRDAG